MGFSSQGYWSGLPFLLPGDLSNPEIKPGSITSPPLAGRFFTTGTTWEALDYKLEDTKAYPGITQGAEISWSKGIEIIQSLLSLWNYIRNQYQKIFENNPHIFKCSVM